jgi:ubiquinol-cytochrome c reductase iron-sulfur subunit
MTEHTQGSDHRSDLVDGADGQVVHGTALQVSDEGVHGHMAGHDPSLPVHTPRRTDTDPRAARRVERQVSLLFLIGMLSPIAFWVEYIQIPKDAIVQIPGIGLTSASNFWLGLTMGVGLFCIGAGAIHWAKKLMPDVEEVAHRHPTSGDADDRAVSAEDFLAGAEDSGFPRFKMIRRTLLGALALSPVFAIPLLWDLGPRPGNSLRYTLWGPGIRVVTDVSLQPIKPSDVPFGGLVSCVPANLAAVEAETGNQNARAKVPVVLVRLRPEEIVSQQGPNWDVDGILCYSKICTHVGCPTALYEQQTHHLLCPCHQSTFDLADSGKVVFGPAARNMPQLAITVDADGYIVAQHDFTQPVGPSFWERG